MPLTQKQAVFCQAYLRTGNASEAYRQAYNAGKMAEQTIWRKACAMLKKGKVRARVGELRQMVQQLVVVDEARTIEELASIVFSDPRDYFDADGKMKPPKDWNAKMAAAVASIEVDEITMGGDKVLGYTKKLKFWDKNAACSNLMKHLGMFERDNQQRTPSPIASLPREVQKQLYDRLNALARGREKVARLTEPTDAAPGN